VYIYVRLEWLIELKWNKDTVFITIGNFSELRAYLMELWKPRNST